MPDRFYRGESRPAARNAVDFRRWLLAATVFPLAAAGAFIVATPGGGVPTAVDLTDALQQPLATTPVPVDTGPDSVEVTVRRNDTMDRILQSVGIDDASLTLAQLRSLPEVRKAVDFLRPGDTITLTHLNGALLTLNRRISDTLTLSVSRAEGGFAVNYIENPLEVEVTGKRARIDSSLFVAGRQAGMSAETVMTLANEIFGWDVDFANDIRAGDEFAVLYQRRFQDGQYVSDGRVLAAEFVNRGKTYRAVWFESSDGKVKGYYTPEGRGMRKAFLRAPLDFTRVSSGFNPNRRHPISGRIRAHKGIDFAAPTGTPIWAAGDGRVDFAGRKGGYGNTVVIDHGRGITTLYAHMSRIGKSARRGREVRQGELIGYVGSTGASTGPHLHYEYRIRGVHKNPASIPLPNTEVPERYRAEFRGQAETGLSQLELTSGAGATRVALN